MAYDIIFNLGANNDNKFIINTMPNYKLTWDFVITVDTTYINSKPKMNIIISYYVNNSKFPIKNTINMRRSLGNIIYKRSIDKLQHFLQNIKNKQYAKYGHIEWFPNTNIWHCKLYGHKYLREYGINFNDLKLELNDDSLEQFVQEFESLIQFYKLIKYKQDTLNPSIIDINIHNN